MFRPLTLAFSDFKLFFCGIVSCVCESPGCELQQKIGDPEVWYCVYGIRRSVTVVTVRLQFYCKLGCLADDTFHQTQL